MSYLVTKTRVASLTINGADYTPNFASWTVSDSSALTNGLVSTSGSLTLRGVLGGALLQDYDRNNFQRGVEVILELTEPGGATYRHPRGLLYVIGDGYSVEDEQITIEIGCRVALATLIDDATTLLSYAPIPLDPTQQTASTFTKTTRATSRPGYFSTETPRLGLVSLQENGSLFSEPQLCQCSLFRAVVLYLTRSTFPMPSQPALRAMALDRLMKLPQNLITL